MLVLELMHFADELADPGKLDVPKKTEVGKRETNIAKSLIDSMSSKWNPEKYKDDYREALMEVIEEKVEAGGKEIEEKPKKAPKPTKVIDLVSVLQKSLEETGAKKKTTVRSRKKQKQPAKKQRDVATGLWPVLLDAKSRQTAHRAVATAPTGLTPPLAILQPDGHERT